MPAPRYHRKNLRHFAHLPKFPELLKLVDTMDIALYDSSYGRGPGNDDIHQFLLWGEYEPFESGILARLAPRENGDTDPIVEVGALRHLMAKDVEEATRPTSVTITTEDLKDPGLLIEKLSIIAPDIEELRQLNHDFGMDTLSQILFHAAHLRQQPKRITTDLPGLIDLLHEVQRLAAEWDVAVKAVTRATLLKDVDRGDLYDLETLARLAMIEDIYFGESMELALAQAPKGEILDLIDGKVSMEELRKRYHLDHECVDEEDADDEPLDDGPITDEELRRMAEMAVRLGWKPDMDKAETEAEDTAADEDDDMAGDESSVKPQPPVDIAQPDYDADEIRALLNSTTADGSNLWQEITAASNQTTLSTTDLLDILTDVLAAAIQAPTENDERPYNVHTFAHARSGLESALLDDPRLDPFINAGSLAVVNFANHPTCNLDEFAAHRQHVAAVNLFRSGSTETDLYVNAASQESAETVNGDLDTFPVQTRDLILNRIKSIYAEAVIGNTNRIAGIRVNRQQWEALLNLNGVDIPGLIETARTPRAQPRSRIAEIIQQVTGSAPATPAEPATRPKIKVGEGETAFAHIARAFGYDPITEAPIIAETDEVPGVIEHTEIERALIGSLTDLARTIATGGEAITDASDMSFYNEPTVEVADAWLYPVETWQQLAGANLGDSHIVHVAFYDSGAHKNHYVRLSATPKS